MADNTTINAGSGGDTLRTDDLGTVKVPVSKIITGGDGVDGGFVSTSNPFPVQSISGSQTGILMGANPVAASNPLAVTSISGSQIGILVGSNPAAQSNPLPVRTMSGSQTGLLMGANPVAASNPLAVTSISGSQIGILVGSNPAAISNPLPVRANAEPGGQILSGSTVAVVRFGSLAATASGSNSIVAAAGAGNRIRVLSVHVMANSAVVVRWKSGATDISGYLPLAANGGFVLPHNPHGWFETAANEALNLDLLSAATCGGTITWIVSGNP